jgi:hypothetical protein
VLASIASMIFRSFLNQDRKGSVMEKILQIIPAVGCCQGLPRSGPGAQGKGRALRNEEAKILEELEASLRKMELQEERTLPGKFSHPECEWAARSAASSLVTKTGYPSWGFCCGEGEVGR